MTKRKMVLIGLVGLSIPLLTVRTLSQTAGLLDNERLKNMSEEEKEKEIQKRREEQRLEFERLRDMTEQEKKRYFEKKRRQRELERKQNQLEFKKKRAEREREMAPIRKQRKLELEKERTEWKKEYEAKKEAVGGFLLEKYGLEATEEQWKPIQVKLEKIQQLRNQAISAIGARVVGSSDAGTKSGSPSFQWKNPWRDNSPDELTEAQKLTRQLVALLERKSTTPQAFRRKIADLRKARIKEVEIERQLVEARRELREGLNTRQEAVLVLMGWL